ncbi:olfactory receptor 1038-like [Hemicordylus capensis]|uniref:olfactory receptor 1038-like n=1 Tax=Hemicordylus capensis TaxID=884348 RepID=UPI002304067C|nr:olfactory receptor 1038-like [Hemicordylus capensis]
MLDIQWENQTIITEFLLLGFGDLQELQIPLSFLFIIIYVLTMAGNILIIVLVVTDQNLHTPMYLFLGNLSWLETCTTSTILPRMLFSFLTGKRTVPIHGCFMQFWVFGSLAASECYLLSAMSYDRYVAICKPLHYTTIMNNKLCLLLVAASWIFGFLANTVLIVFAFQLTFCSHNVIEHFFCDFIPVIQLACTDTHNAMLAVNILGTFCTFPAFILTITSYVYIIQAILRIPSTTGRQKAFSTCSSHLVVVSIFYGTLIIVYVLPKTEMLKELNKFFSVCYTVLTPLVNPLIYSLRNKEVKEAWARAVSKWKSHSVVM